MKQDDAALIEQIQRHWTPPEGDQKSFEAAGVRFHRRRRQRRRVRTGIFVLMFIVAAAALRRGSSPRSVDYLTQTANLHTRPMPLPPEYEALMGTLYGAPR
ncbi:MAG: hypothetical protein AAFU79_19025 [Myxococcota bacterium]